MRFPASARGRSTLLFLAGAAAALLAVFAGSYLAALSPAHGRDPASRMPTSAIRAARAWFERHGTTADAVAEIPVGERAKRLTQAVYSFCENGPAPRNPDSLFVRCSAQCGGYAYVLRGLLEATGATTRIANLYNIPNQGNHTAMEVREEEDRWAYYDATFGAYFTEDGKPESRTLSLTEIAHHDADLRSRVLQSPKEPREFLTAPLESLFGERFDHPFMKVENYRLAEWMTFDDPGHLLSLDIPLVVTGSGATFGMLTTTSLPELEREWLRQTNASLNDAEPLNDVSYVASRLDNGAAPSQTTISLSGLEPGRLHRIRLLLFGTRENQRLQLAAIGKGTRLELPPEVTVQPGGRLLEARFLPQRSTAQLLLRNVEPTGTIHVFGVSVTPL